MRPPEAVASIRHVALVSIECGYGRRHVIGRAAPCTLPYQLHTFRSAANVWLACTPRPAGAVRHLTLSASIIERAGRVLAEAARSPARVILFGSGAHDEGDADSDLDFLVIERSVEDRIAEAVRLRRVLGDIGVPVDIVVLDEALAARRAKVPGTMVHNALRDGRVIAQS